MSLKSVYMRKGNFTQPCTQPLISPGGEVHTVIQFQIDAGSQARGWDAL